MRKKWLLFISVFALTLLLVACGGNDEDTDVDTGPADDQTEEQTDEGVGDEATSYDADAADNAYQQSCSSCHGGNLEGENGPALEGVGLSEDDILDAIENGRPGMPEGLLQGDEAENVAAWLADKQ